MRFKMKLIPTAILVATIAALTMAVTARAEDEKSEGKEAMEAKEAKMSQKDLPGAVLTAFQKAYPKAKINGVSTENDSTGKVTEFEIESAEGAAKRTIALAADGTILEVEEDITMKDLPQNAQEEIAKTYPKGEAKMIERVMKGDVITFEALIQSGETSAEMVFDKTGKVIKSEKKAEDEEGDEEED